MWALFMKRFRLYLLFAVGAPVVAFMLDEVGQRLERSRGESTATRALRSGGDWLRQHGRGPLAKRLRREQAQQEGGYGRAA